MIVKPLQTRSRGPHGCDDAIGARLEDSRAGDPEAGCQTSSKSAQPGSEAGWLPW